jgi:hypothetical protein
MDYSSKCKTTSTASKPTLRCVPSQNVAVGINVGCSPRNDVRAVVSGFDFNLCHSLPPVQEYDLDIIVNIDILSMFISENLDKIWQI